MPVKITFLLHSAYGMGGTIRSNVILANYLAERHEVEIITVLRRREQPFFAVDPRITMRTLMDLRGGKGNWLDAWLRRFDSRLIPRNDHTRRDVMLCGDLRLWHALRTLRTDVVITTRGGYNLLAARFARRGAVIVGREHLNFGIHDDDMLMRIARWY